MGLPADMGWCAEGPSAYPKRKAVFEKQKARMESEMRAACLEWPTLKMSYGNRGDLIPLASLLRNRRRVASVHGRTQALVSNRADG